MEWNSQSPCKLDMIDSQDLFRSGRVESSNKQRSHLIENFEIAPQKTAAIHSKCMKSKQPDRIFQLEVQPSNNEHYQTSNDCNISTEASIMLPSLHEGKFLLTPFKICLTLLTLQATTIITLGYEVEADSSVLHNSSLFQDNCRLAQENVPSARVEPMVVIGGDMGSEIAASNIESMSSIRLTDNTKTSCPDTLKIYFSGFGDRFVIDLVKNKRLISDRYFKISNDHPNRHNRHPDASPRASRNLSINEQDDEFYRNHKFLNLHNFTSNNDHCHYHGFANDNLGSMSAISIVNHRLLSGFFLHNKEIYYLHANTSNWSTVLTKTVDISGCNRATDLKLSDLFPSLSLNLMPDSPKTSRLRRSVQNRKRSSMPVSDNIIKHYPFRSNASSLYVEMLVVHDHSQFKEYRGNTSNIAERTMQIVNIMNAFYKQLNIFVALVGVVLWVERDEIQLTEDGDSTLTNFLKYRYEKLLPKYHHDNAQLITSTSFNGSVVGKALKGPICTHEHSGGVNTDHSHSPAIVAVTLAHELGHNLGMEHDEEEKCKCPDEKCIMSSSSSAVHPKHWSSCSIDQLEESKKHGLLDCLTNQPEKVFGPICGNGFVEEGEDCDIGEPIPTYGTSKSRKSATQCLRDHDCDPVQAINPCCNRQTCKFIGNATCAQGPCCDLTRCSAYNATETKICRSRQTECDLEEVCDGKSEFCPPDVHYHDGIECDSGHLPLPDTEKLDSFNPNRSRAYCYQGKCASHESQCQLLWGPSGSVSKDICFEQNLHGNMTGNCGFNRREKTYEGCEPEDAICGMLHCVHNQVDSTKKTGKLGYGFESASVLTVSFFVMSNHARIYCNGAIIDAGQNHRDPGLVPNGAACGDDKVCVNQKCVPLHDIMYENWCPSDCNGNGICDNLGVCHCNDGTIGTSCYQFFGPNFHLSLIMYIFVFFIPMIMLIVVAINHYKNQLKIWWFLHTRKSFLREKAKLSKQQRRTMIPYETSGNHIRTNHNQISISEPIPLNQRDNSSRPFYEPPSLDPWTETSSQVGKSPGFRLEPIKPKPPPPAHNQMGGGSTVATGLLFQPQPAARAKNQVHKTDESNSISMKPGKCRWHHL